MSGARRRHNLGSIEALAGGTLARIEAWHRFHPRDGRQRPELTLWDRFDSRFVATPAGWRISEHRGSEDERESEFPIQCPDECAIVRRLGNSTDPARRVREDATLSRSAPPARDYADRGLMGLTRSELGDNSQPTATDLWWYAD